MIICVFLPIRPFIYRSIKNESVFKTPCSTPRKLNRRSISTGDLTASPSFSPAGQAVATAGRLVRDEGMAAAETLAVRDQLKQRIEQLEAELETYKEELRLRREETREKDRLAQEMERLQVVLSVTKLQSNLLIRSCVSFVGRSIFINLTSSNAAGERLGLDSEERERAVKPR